jgi:hypothetical protein
MIGPHLHSPDFQYIPNQLIAPPFDGRTVLMDVVLLSADPVAGVMTMDWTVIGEENLHVTPIISLPAPISISFLTSASSFGESQFPFNDIRVSFHQ